MRRPDSFPSEVRAVVADRLHYLLGRADHAQSPGQAQPVGPAGPAGRAVEAGEDGQLEDELAAVSLPDRPAFSRAHLTVVTVLVLLGLLGAGWALFRARPVAVAAPGAVAVTAAAPTTGPPSPAAASPGRSRIVVHVVGAVRQPGLARLPDGARVQDAVDAAGGLTRAARPGRLNLAQVLADGQQVVVGTARDPVSEVRDQTGAAGGPTADPSAGSRGGTIIDLNRAGESELEQLPGVGPVTAAAIVAWRTRHGRFSAVAELQQVDGIGPKTYAQIAPHVRV